MHPVKLHVNVDHIATLRQARGTRYPDPVAAASLCEQAGADGITVHLREDRRHIQDRDVRILRETTRGVLNLEMAATPEMIRFACALKPDVVTLVPEKREERTTEGGLDVIGAAGRAAVERAVGELGAAGLPVSLFIDPETAAVEVSRALGVPRVELHTGDYCERSHGVRSQAGDSELDRLSRAAELAGRVGLHVAAGHGLDYGNVGSVATIPEVVELNIGHALVARAVLVGLDRAIRDMLHAIGRGST